MFVSKKIKSGRVLKQQVGFGIIYFVIACLILIIATRGIALFYKDTELAFLFGKYIFLLSNTFQIPLTLVCVGLVAVSHKLLSGDD